MNETVSPVVPFFATILGYGIFVVWVALLVIAVLTLLRAEGMSVLGRALWCLAMIVLPVVGCLAWLVYYGLNRQTLRPIKT